MKRSIVFGFVAGCLLTGGRVGAQEQNEGYAGPDKTICPGKSTTIGGTGNGSFCYKWTPETNLSDPTSPNPTANPTSTTTYTVEVTSEDLSFATTDAMTLKADGIEQMNVTTNKCCWKKGEPFKETEFDIVKVPTDLEGEIIFDPPSAPYSSFQGAENTETIMVKFKCGDAVLAKPVQITVVDEDFKFSAANQQWNVNRVGFINKVCDLAGKIREKMSIAPTAFCQPNVSCTFDTPGTSFSVGKLCCSESQKCVRNNFRLNAISGGISGGVQCYWPFYGVPLVASVNVLFSASANVLFSYNPIGADCDAENKQCIKASPSINFQLGVAGCLGPCMGEGSIVKVQGSGNATFTPNRDLEYCWPSAESKPFSLCGQLDLEGSVTFVSLYSKKYKVNVVPKKCL